MGKNKRSKKSSIFYKPDLAKVLIIFILLLFPVIFYFYLNRENETYCANSISCINDLSGEFDENQTKGEFLGEVVEVPTTDTSADYEEPVLGKNTLENKRIYINLTNQTLYAVEGRNVIYKFLISSGKWGRTPTGKFNIWIKLNATRMSGGSHELGTYYDLPNVPWTMYFYNNEIPKSRGYGIHGAYWHNNFGHPMSHGCINMKIDEAKTLYEWAEPVSTGYTTYAEVENSGTQITIFGVAPDY